MLMNNPNWLEQLSYQTQLAKLLEINSFTESFGLSLSPEEARLILAERNHTLKDQKRVEVGSGILPELIREFCDSAYLTQDNYVETLIRLQEIFFLYKNEMMDEISDSELLHFMKEQFETICCGDLDYLEGSCLNIFAQAIRAGYRDYRYRDGRGQYSRFDEVQRWDHELYMEALKEWN